MTQRFSDANEVIRAPLAWAIATAAVASVFAVVVMIANYGPLNGAKDETLRAQLGDARYDDIAALIRASGQACAKVCAVRQPDTLSAATALDVDCAPPERPSACAAPVHLRISIAPAP